MPGPVGVPTAAEAHLESFNQLKAFVLRRAQEEDDGTSDWDTETGSFVVEAFHDLIMRVPWLGLRKDPPGALALLAPITNLTITAAAGGTSGTLSAVYATSLIGYVVIPSVGSNGNSYIIRITAHTAGTNAVTLDAVPETLTAQACTIVKIEYDLASDVGVLVDGGFWTLESHFIPVVAEEQLRQEHPDTPKQYWPARCAARVARRKVRFSSYPEAGKRLEYPYNWEPGDPSGDAGLVIDVYLRPLVAERALSYLYEAKHALDLAKLAEGRYLAGLDVARVYEERLLVGLGSHARQPRSRRGYGN